MSNYERTLFSYLENLKSQIRSQPLNLGGVSSSGGGSGGPPGGFLGRIPQTRVTYDKLELGTSTTSGTPSLYDNLNHIRYRLNTLESGPTNLNIEQDDILVASGIKTLNYEGSVNVLDEGNNKVTVTVSGGSGETNTMANLGIGEGVYYQKEDNEFQLKSLLGSGNISLFSDNNEITISGSSGNGEANTISNIGGGAGLFYQKTGIDFELKSLYGANNVAIDPSNSYITISGYAGGSRNQLQYNYYGGFDGIDVYWDDTGYGYKGLGINNSNPTRDLVVGDGSRNAYIKTLGNTVAGWLFSDNSSNDLDNAGYFLYEFSANKMVFGAGDTDYVLELYGDKAIVKNDIKLAVGHDNPDTRVDINGALTLRELSSDPDDPDEGASVMWMSDGTDSGNDGEVLIKTTADSTTRTEIIADKVQMMSMQWMSI